MEEVTVFLEDEAKHSLGRKRCWYEREQKNQGLYGMKGCFSNYEGEAPASRWLGPDAAK